MERLPRFCRDKGRGWVDVGAWCLSSLGCDHCASRNSNGIVCHQDKHKAPALSRIRPLSLQDGGAHITTFVRQRSSGRGRVYDLSDSLTSRGTILRAAPNSALFLPPPWADSGLPPPFPPRRSPMAPA